MDQTVLVSMDIQKGAEVVAALDRAKLKISVALFANLEEYGDWRLILAGRSFDPLELRKAFRLVHDSVDAAGSSVDEDLPLLIYSMKDPFIRDLRKKYAKSERVEGTRLSYVWAGGKFIDDSYVYRLR